MAIDVLFSVEIIAGKVYKHNGFSSSILDCFSSPQVRPRGLGWDGTNLLSIAWGEILDDRKIYKHDGFSASILDSFISPYYSPYGLDWDGTNVLSSDDGDDKIYKHDGFSSAILDWFSTGPLPTGVAWGTVATYKLEGVTKDKDGSILGNCLCFLFKDNQDNTLTYKAYILSNAVTGAYSFAGILDDDAQYIVVAWKDNTPHVFDVTDHVLQPVVE